MPARPLTAKQPSRNTGARQFEQVVLYARVSSKDQEKEGFSIQAQLRLLREYAAARGGVVLQEFVDVETAKASGRTRFGEMLLYLKKHSATCRTVVTEKTDRLYRNLKDWTTLDNMGTTIHLVKEGRIIGPDSGSADHLVHGFNVLMARNYVMNLGEETRKGMLEKARSGIYPSYARVGYRNTEGPNGKRIIVPDPEACPIVTELFTRFATGGYSLEDLVDEFRAEGVTLRGRRIFKSLAHQILRNRLYMGQFDWDGITYQGSHEPLVSRECWETVQELLNKRAETKTRKVKRDFPFRGLIQCGHCGCLLVGELKKERYVYYHCTGNRGKCPEPYTREYVLADAFLGVLRELVIPQEVLDWLADAVIESDRTERSARERTVKRLWADHERLNCRIETMYLDKLEGRITGEFFDQHSAAWRRAQDAIVQRINDIRSSGTAPVEEAVNALRLTSRACELFEQQNPSEQRRLLHLLIDKASWQDGKLRTVLFEPFEILRHSNRESSRKESQISGSRLASEIWLLR